MQEKLKEKKIVFYSIYRYQNQKVCAFEGFVEHDDDGCMLPSFDFRYKLAQLLTQKNKNRENTVIYIKLTVVIKTKFSTFNRFFLTV